MNCALSLKTHSTLSASDTWIRTHTPTHLRKDLLCPSRTLHSPADMNSLGYRLQPPLAYAVWEGPSGITVISTTDYSDLYLASSSREWAERNLIHNLLPSLFKNKWTKEQHIWGDQSSSQVLSLHQIFYNFRTCSGLFPSRKKIRINSNTHK